MDSFELPWALIYGNHDYVVKVPIEKQNEVYENIRSFVHDGKGRNLVG